MKEFSKNLVLLAVYLPIIFWLGVVLYLLNLKDYSTLIFIFAGGLILRAICEIIYFFYKSPRPYQILKKTVPNMPWLGSPSKTTHDSFPSAHAAVMFFLAFFMLFLGYYKIGAFGLLAAAFNGYSRVKLLYHYKIDIFGGLALASLWLIFMAFVARM